MGVGVKAIRWLALTLLALSCLTLVNSRPDDDLDPLIKDIFGQPPGTNGETNVDNRNPVNGDHCECVPYYLCPNGSIIDDGTGLIDIRFGATSCESYMDECCKAPPLVEPITPAPIKREGCGIRNTDGVGFRITGAFDNEAQFGEFPWMIAILKEELVEDGNVLNVYQCGGSLIHHKIVLTAAHCVVSKNLALLKARGGEWDTQMTQELYPHQDRKIQEVIVHEKYHAGSLRNDIALLILDEPFSPASNLDIVCLPHQGAVILENECFASGWGKDTFGKEGQYQVILKRVQLPMVPRDKCEDALKRTRLGQRFTLHESFVCAGGIAGADTCKGDGGSPLVCPVKFGKELQYQQVGIVAWGIGCGTETPAVYVNVANFVDWIDRQMSKYAFPIDYHY